jgi:methionyl-tRNA formyltransferase
MRNLRIVFAGTPEFARPALAALLASRHRVVGVLTQPDRPAGRGLELRASPVKQLALAHGIAVDQPVTLKTVEGRAQLGAWQPDLLVVVAYGLILPQAVLDLSPLGCLNIHGSLLPRWRGAAPIQRALLAGDAETGVAIMRLEAGLDTGPVYVERRLPIAGDATAGDVHDQLATLGAEALLETVNALAAGTAVARPQPSEGVTYAHKIDKAEAAIDWMRSAEEIARQVRAFNPWPVAYTTLAGEPLKIHLATAAPDASRSAEPATPGQVLGANDLGLLVACGSGVLAIGKLQRAGKRPVSAREFANAVPLAGLRLGA